jgi:hypothetical protein
MNPLHWTWAAIVADLGLLISPAMLSDSSMLFWGVLLAHAAISAVVALSTYLLLPQRFRQPRTFVAGLMFCFAFIAPVLGAVGLLIIIRGVLRKTLAESSFAVPMAVEIPVYDVQSKDVQRGSSQGAIRSRLGQEVPSHLRMQSLLTLQAVPSRVSNPILEELLGDDSDDVRLVAFGMLDTEEKKIASAIRQESERLEHAQTPEARFGCLRQLAELNWELVYACLAQGELRRHILAQAARFADEALALGVSLGSGLHFLRGRIWLEQGDLDAAEHAIEQAVAQGQPRTSAWPYLAEIAFRRRDFVAVRQYMQQLSKLNLASRTRAVEDFWVHRSNEINFRDHTYLPHI